VDERNRDSDASSDSDNSAASHNNTDAEEEEEDDNALRQQQQQQQSGSQAVLPDTDKRSSKARSGSSKHSSRKLDADAAEKEGLPLYGQIVPNDGHWNELDEDDRLNQSITAVRDSYIESSALLPNVTQRMYKFDLPLLYIDGDGNSVDHAEVLSAINKPPAEEPFKLLYDHEEWRKQPRFHARFPGPMLPLYSTEHVQTTTCVFKPEITQAASYADVVAYAEHAQENGCIPLFSEPGQLPCAKLPTTQRQAAALHKHGDARHHVIPLHIECASGRNTLTTDLSLSIQVPNSEWISTPGCGSCGAACGVPPGETCKMHASQTPSTFRALCGDQLVCGNFQPGCARLESTAADNGGERDPVLPVMHQACDVFSSPEAARWALISARAECEKMQSQDSPYTISFVRNNKSIRHARKLDAKSKAAAAAAAAADQKQLMLISISLRTQPRDFIEWLAVSYSHAIVIACSNERLPAPLYRATDLDNLLGEHVVVPVQALVYVIEKYASHYGPHKYATNNRMWRVSAQPACLDDVKLSVVRGQVCAKGPVALQAKLEITYLPFPTRDNWLDSVNDDQDVLDARAADAARLQVQSAEEAGAPGKRRKRHFGDYPCAPANLHADVEKCRTAQRLGCSYLASEVGKYASVKACSTCGVCACTCDIPLHASREQMRAAVPAVQPVRVAPGSGSAAELTSSSTTTTTTTTAPHPASIKPQKTEHKWRAEDDSDWGAKTPKPSANAALVQKQAAAANQAKRAASAMAAAAASASASAASAGSARTPSNPPSVMNALFGEPTFAQDIQGATKALNRTWVEAPKPPAPWNAPTFAQDLRGATKTLNRAWVEAPKPSVPWNKPAPQTAGSARGFVEW